MVVGKKYWIIPDCELPPEGEGVLKGHESVVIVNDSDKEAVIDVKIFYVDKAPKSARNLVEQGFAFFAGNVTLKRKFSILHSF